MKNRFAPMVVVGVLAACGSAQDESASGTAANVDTESAEYAALQYRQGLMHVIDYKAAKLRGMADGDIPVDEAEFVRSANDLVAATAMLEDAFPEGTDSRSLPGASNALPGIWSDWTDFVERRTTLQTAAETVADQARSGGFAAAQASASELLGPACGSCHRPYRRRSD